MPSCSVHHCVLFLLTLTLTTDPGSAVCEFPIYAKLHQSVTLPCEATQCSGRGWWSLHSQRDDVFARCDQTSCRSVQQGYEMSHDQYKRGDLSLTITNPDYSMRKTYTCECGDSDYAIVRLRISTVFSAVQMRPGEDLKLDLSVPESVEVIYRRSDSADDVQICTVTNRTLECNTEYTPRTSLSNSELTLRDVQRSESGTYTIRNLDYKEDIRVYAVSVSGLTSGETAGIVIGVLLVLLVLLVPLIGGVMNLRWIKAEPKCRQVDSLLTTLKGTQDESPESSNVGNKSQSTEELALKTIEEKTDLLLDHSRIIENPKLQNLFSRMKLLNISEDSQEIRVFCMQKSNELEMCRSVYNQKHKFQTGLLERETEEVPTEQLMEKLQEVTEMLDMFKHKKDEENRTTLMLFHIYSHVESNLDGLDTWFRNRRAELNEMKHQQNHRENDIRLLCDMEALLNHFEQSVNYKRFTLEECRRNLKSEGSYDDLTALWYNEEEVTPLHCAV